MIDLGWHGLYTTLAIHSTRVHCFSEGLDSFLKGVRLLDGVLLFDFLLYQDIFSCVLSLVSYSFAPVLLNIAAQHDTDGIVVAHFAQKLTKGVIGTVIILLTRAGSSIP